MKKQVETTTIDNLIPDTHNANAGTQRGAGMMERSISECGLARSIVIDKNNKIIAGNKTTETAAALGIEHVIVVETDGSALVAVKRRDIDIDSEQGRRLAYFDNRTNQVDLDWQLDQLNFDRELLDGIFTDAELDALMKNDIDEPEQDDTDLKIKLVFSGDDAVMVRDALAKHGGTVKDLVLDLCESYVVE